MRNRGEKDGMCCCNEDADSWLDVQLAPLREFLWGITCWPPEKWDPGINEQSWLRDFHLERQGLYVLRRGRIDPLFPDCLGAGMTAWYVDVALHTKKLKDDGGTGPPGQWH